MQLAVIVALAATLIVSWGWFYFAQKRTDEQVSMLMSKVSAPGQRGGRPVGDPYRDEAVKNTLRKHAAEIQKLWIDYLAKRPDRTEGAIEADWQIDADGRVAAAGIVHSDFEDKDLAEGVLKVLREITYPPPPTGLRTYVAHKFNLKKD